ncbi:MAG: GNAT family N-acetyltransferase [Geminicoccaceae bacterium]
MIEDVQQNVEIKEGYIPSLIGRIVELHARYYSELVGFGAAFESKVAGGLAEFVPRLERPGNAIWHLDDDGSIAGSLAIDGEGLGGGAAHLRWFLIDAEIRGAGFGQALMDEALAFCDDRDVQKIQLSTFKGLDAARHLYERNGFTLINEQPGDQWGAMVQEQTFLRERPSPLF